MTPTIGRIVRVFHESEPAAAMITAVHANGDLSVTVFPPGAVPYPKTVSDSEWEWPKIEVPTPTVQPNSGKEQSGQQQTVIINEGGGGAAGGENPSPGVDGNTDNQPA